MAFSLLKRLIAPPPAKPLGPAGEMSVDVPGVGTVEVDLKPNPRARRMTLRFDGGADRFRLTVPPGLSLTEARRFVASQTGWIAKRLADAPPRRPFTPGAVVPILGVDHVIVHVSGGGRRPVEQGTVTADDGAAQPALIVSGDVAHVARRVEDYLKRLARDRIGPLARSLAEELVGFRPTARRPTRIAIRDARTRWGSCSARGALAFSWRLVLAPEPVFRYVVVHEVAHLAEMNHGPRFWGVVDRLMPDYETYRAWLTRHGSMLHRHG